MVAQQGDIYQGTAPLLAAPLALWDWDLVPQVPSSLVGTLLEVGFKRAEAKQC